MIKAGLLGPDTVEGTSGNDIIFGLAGDDLLRGFEGGDALVGGSGADVLEGGDGNDVLYAAAPPSLLTLGLSQLDLVLAGVDAPAIVASLLLGDDGAANTLRGGAGDDTLFGGVGGDVLDGGSGIDAMTGGDGADTYVVDDAGDQVTEQGADVDTVVSLIDYVLGAGLEQLVLVGAALRGEGNDADGYIVGNALNNVLLGRGGLDTIMGGAGADFIDGGAGADVMWGGLGDDSFVIDTTADTVFEAAGEGLDTIYSSVETGLPDGVEQLVLTGTTAVDGSGGEFDGYVRGNAIGNRLFGLAGADTIDGAEGDDAIDGGVGNDSLIGGAGVDIFEYRSAGFGIDYIRDFEDGPGVGGDQLRFGLANFVDAADVLDSAFQSGADTVIVAPDGSYIVLQNVALSGLGADDFLFV